MRPEEREDREWFLENCSEEEFDEWFAAQESGFQEWLKRLKALKERYQEAAKADGEDLKYRDGDSND